jgi:hypothetical protein
VRTKVTFAPVGANIASAVADAEVSTLSATEADAQERLGTVVTSRPATALRFNAVVV